MAMETEPCGLCRTTGGRAAHKGGKPERKAGLCHLCFYRCYKRKVRHGLATLAEAIDMDRGSQQRKNAVKVGKAAPVETALPEPVPVLFASPGFREVWEGAD